MDLESVLILGLGTKKRMLYVKMPVRVAEVAPSPVQGTGRFPHHRRGLWEADVRGGSEREGRLAPPRQSLVRTRSADRVLPGAGGLGPRERRLWGARHPQSDRTHRERHLPRAPGPQAPTSFKPQQRPKCDTRTSAVGLSRPLPRGDHLETTWRRVPPSLDVSTCALDAESA